MPKLIVRKPIFNDGDCLELQINEDIYSAALVLQSDDSSVEYGKNLIIALDYWSKTPPTIDIYSEPVFLSMTFGNWNQEIHKSWYSHYSYRNLKSKIKKIGNVNVERFKTISCNSYSNWDSLFRMIILQNSHASQ
jgi:hypothetical protein